MTTNDPFAFAGHGDEADAAILAMFRDWQRVQRECIAGDDEDDAEREEQANAAIWAIEQRINEAEVAGPIGLAIKAFLAVYRNDGFDIDDDPINLTATEDLFAADDTLRVALRAVKGLMTSAAAFVPELGTFAGELIALPLTRPAEPDDAAAIEALRAECERLIALYKAPLPAGDDGLIEAVRRADELEELSHFKARGFVVTVAIEDAVYRDVPLPEVQEEFYEMIEEWQPQTMRGALAKFRYGVESGFQFDEDFYGPILAAIEREAGRAPSWAPAIPLPSQAPRSIR